MKASLVKYALSVIRFKALEFQLWEDCTPETAKGRALAEFRAGKLDLKPEHLRPKQSVVNLDRYADLPREQRARVREVIDKIMAPLPPPIRRWMTPPTPPVTPPAPTPPAPKRRTAAPAPLPAPSNAPLVYATGLRTPTFIDGEFDLPRFRDATTENWRASIRAQRERGNR